MCGQEMRQGGRWKRDVLLICGTRVSSWESGSIDGRSRSAVEIQIAGTTRRDCRFHLMEPDLLEGMACDLEGASAGCGKCVVLKGQCRIAGLSVYRQRWEAIDRFARHKEKGRRRCLQGRQHKVSLLTTKLSTRAAIVLMQKVSAAETKCWKSLRLGLSYESSYSVQR